MNHHKPLRLRPGRRASARPLMLAAALVIALIAPGPATAAEPAGYEHFHTYAEVNAVIDAAVADHPSIAARFSLGHSHEGRKIWGLKISDNVGQDEDEPEVLFNGLMHARERLSGEMVVHILELLTDGYGVDQRITDIVDSREVWVIPMLNPDGAEYDFSGGEFHRWRKNRQPIPGSTEIGVDLNRGYDFMWGCCGGSSPNPPSDNYRGPEPWWAPEVRAFRDFVDSRVVGGRQQIRAQISWHTAGRMVLWPYGYTKANVPSTMSYDDWRAFVGLGGMMAGSNGYRAQQGSDLYIVDGDQDDWAYHEHRIFAYTFEMAKGAAKRYYPTAAEVAAELANNEEAVLLMLEYADCPYRAAGLAATHCGPLNDDFEASRGWQVDAFGTDSATGGAWQRARPDKTRDARGVKQKPVPPSGQSLLVTGAAAGGDVAANDVDGGTTTVLSPPIDLGPGAWTLNFRFAVGHDATATRDDFLRVSVVRGSRKRALWTLYGKGSNRNAKWLNKTLRLDAYAGQTIRLLFVARDGAADSLFEAAADNVRVYQTP